MSNIEVKDIKQFDSVHISAYSIKGNMDVCITDIKAHAGISLDHGSMWLTIEDAETLIVILKRAIEWAQSKNDI